MAVVGGGDRGARVVIGFGASSSSCLRRCQRRALLAFLTALLAVSFVSGALAGATVASADPAVVVAASAYGYAYDALRVVTTDASRVSTELLGDAPTSMALKRSPTPWADGRLAAKAVGGSKFPRFVSAGGEVIDTASPALGKQIDEVADSIVATGRPPTGVRQGGLPGRPGVYGNRGGQLPSRPEGYYTESDIWAGTGARGTERVVVGRRGEVWYTPDHYGTFRRVR
jgi:guanyl-specific ribonuclease Sa